jgi:hypothetical protein
MTRTMWERHRERERLWDQGRWVHVWMAWCHSYRHLAPRHDRGRDDAMTDLRDDAYTCADLLRMPEPDGLLDSPEGAATRIIRRTLP